MIRSVAPRTAKLPIGGNRKTAKIRFATAAPRIPALVPHKWAIGIVASKNSRGAIQRAETSDRSRHKNPAIPAHRVMATKGLCLKPETPLPLTIDERAPTAKTYSTKLADSASAI